MRTFRCKMTDCENGEVRKNLGIHSYSDTTQKKEARNDVLLRFDEAF
jgi:hypothetical protein